jgi:putative addiction module killer protein
MDKRFTLIINPIYGTIKMALKRLPEFQLWIAEQDLKSIRHIESRLRRIREHGYFGDSRDLGGELFELKWKNGRRVYFSVDKYPDGTIIILILGGNKNGQSKDIQKARKILSDTEKQTL